MALNYQGKSQKRSAVEKLVSTMISLVTVIEIVTSSVIPINNYSKIYQL